MQTSSHYKILLKSQDSTAPSILESQTVTARRSLSPVSYISDNDTARQKKKGLFHINLSNQGQDWTFCVKFMLCTFQEHIVQLANVYQVSCSGQTTVQVFKEIIKAGDYLNEFISLGGRQAYAYKRLTNNSKQYQIQLWPTVF